ncbi:MAG: dTDP-4-dehydrorhamnose reductase [Chloroflexi bacterium]|nr:MAG: dTDP-4-dehydrorhamnose reductase [Chloroflexota bacterium]
MRLLILGAGGQLGSELVEVAPAIGEDVVGLTRAECDIRDEAAVDGALGEHHPDAVINCAAWTAVDAAEDHPDEARAVNTVAPAIIAAACEERAVRLCHISTDYVFDGTATEPIAEDATPHPLSVYGRTKLEGEDAVRQYCRDYLVVRTSWVHGRDGPNFVLMVLRLLDGGQAQLRMVADQWGSPTWTGHLAPALLRLVKVAPAGTYHLGGSGTTTRHGQAAGIVEELGLEVAVEPVSSDAFPARAVRPRYSALDNRAWRALGEPDLPPWRVGLHDYLAALGRLR